MKASLSKTYCILFFICCSVIFCGCHKSQADTPEINNNLEIARNKNNLKAIEVIEDLKNAKLPIDKIEFFTSETDFENLLGKPNQYIEKVSWIDTRIETDSADNLVGGGIEVFKTVDLFQKRKGEWLRKEEIYGLENYYLKTKTS